MTDDVPVFPFNAVRCKYRKAPVLPFPECNESRAFFEATHARYYPDLVAAAEKAPGVQVLNTADYFCDDYICSMNKGNALLYRDANHLNNEGSRLVSDYILTRFAGITEALSKA